MYHYYLIILATVLHLIITMRYLNLGPVWFECDLGGISASLDSLWNSQLLSSSSTLYGVIDNFYRDRLKKTRTTQDDWNQMLQNILAFRSADGFFHNGDDIPDLRSEHANFMVRLGSAKLGLVR